MFIICFGQISISTDGVNWSQHYGFDLPTSMESILILYPFFFNLLSCTCFPSFFLFLLFFVFDVAEI